MATLANPGFLHSVRTKSNADDHAPRIPLKKLEDESHEVERCREPREAPVHRPKDVIEEQRHSDHARNLDDAHSEVAATPSMPRTKHSVNAAVSMTSKKKDTGNPGLETRRHLPNQPYHFIAPG
jgi:hypothetical protein